MLSPVNIMKNQKNKIPEDLELEIGSKEQVFWTSVKEKCETTIEQCKREIIIQMHILGLADNKISIEKDNL